MVQSVAFACRLFRSIAAAKPRRLLFLSFVVAMLSIAPSAMALTTFTINDGTNDTARNNSAGTCVCQDTQMPAKCTLRAAIETVDAARSSGPFSINCGADRARDQRRPADDHCAGHDHRPAAIDGQNGQLGKVARLFGCGIGAVPGWRDQLAGHCCRSATAAAA
jgi:hypothetical protein